MTTKKILSALKSHKKLDSLGKQASGISKQNGIKRYNGRNI